MNKQAIRIDRLEACYQANIKREHFCMGNWESCLIGGYNTGLARRVQKLIHRFKVQVVSGQSIHEALASHPVYFHIADYFGIEPEEAVSIFVGWEQGIARTAQSALARLRAFIDANSPTINSMDFHRDLTASGALSPAETRGLVTD